MFVLVAEVLFRLLPVSTATRTGYYLDPMILTYPPHHRWRMATGWDLRNPQTLQANNLGFASERDFIPDARALALIGDSFVEASMLDARDRPGVQLERALGGARPVYAMGGPGSALLDYAERIRYAYRHLEVHEFVILMEGGDVRQSFCGSGNIHGPCLDRVTLELRTETLTPPSLAKQVLRQSALAQYLGSQLKFDVRRVLAAAFTRSSHKPVDGSDEPRAAPDLAEPTRQLTAAEQARVDAVTDAFVRRVAEVAPNARVTLVVDGGRRPSGRSLGDTQLERHRFIENMRDRGYKVVDGTQVFASHWMNSQLSLSVGPYDGHMNGHAIGLVMEATAQQLH